MAESTSFVEALCLNIKIITILESGCMFGFYRTMLALWVMAFHLLDIPIIGTYAVFSFFVLSGFLMTTIMHENYEYTVLGVMRYAQNRFLRIYPMYWAAALFSIFVIMVSSAEYSKEYNDALFLPNTLRTTIYNLSMIFPHRIPYTVVPRLSPPTWALTVEIFFYACIGFGISKTKTSTIVWICITVAYYVYSYIADLDGSYRYAFVLGASLPFSIGASLYFFKNTLFKILSNRRLSSPKIWLAFYTANAVFFAFYEHEYHSPWFVVTEVGAYANIIISVIVILTLNYSKYSVIVCSIDKKIGEYSYPIYLLHWQAGLLASMLLFAHPSRGHNIDGIISFAVSLLILLTVCSTFVWFIDRKINVVRDGIRSKSRKRAIGVIESSPNPSL